MTAADVINGGARWCVEHARCEAFSSSLPDGCVNLLWLDPPYFRVVDEEWDRAWKTEADFLAWLRSVVAEAARVLAPNGSLYLFASPQMGGRAEGIATEYFRTLNAVTWAKPERSLAEKYGVENFRQFVPMSERVIFAEPRGPLGGSVLGDRVRVAREAAGLSRDQLGVAIGRVLSADPTKESGLVRLQELGERTPNADDFSAVLRACGDRRPDAVLRAEYERLLRPFAAPAGFTDVWTYAAAASTPSRHPCEKPEAMLRDVVRCSSRLGDVVCEFFGGSFRMAEVALSEGRRYIGCDADEHWARVGVERARAAERGTVAAVPSRRAKGARDEALPLFKVAR